MKNKSGQPMMRPQARIEWLEDGQPENQYDMKFVNPRTMVFPSIPPLKNILPLPPALRDERFNVRAVTRGDFDFLMNLYVASRWQEVAPLIDWTDAQKISFLESQFGMQHMNYLKSHPKGDFMIIERENQPLARLYLDYKETEIQLCEVMVAPVAQRRGLGSWLIRAVQEEGYRLNKTIRLHVETQNRAYTLYKGLGFQEISATDMYITMVWQPAELPTVVLKGAKGSS
ncbi:GNAT family N-acetyltransferase [Terasakiella pusilla]|uniref:GNAT family N-acetyltransferase n=1 Tax=Terasakiella pusilla TaxID=64973 RepID=UPI003AA95909